MSDDHGNLERSTLPSKELFIRWTQLSAYLQSMQFSFVPWQYDEETVRIAKEMVRQHEEIVYPLLLEAGEEMLKTGIVNDFLYFHKESTHVLVITVPEWYKW